jgi:alkylation response protein AidB-like acyl-CoA dehydrogenase
MSDSSWVEAELDLMLTAIAADAPARDRSGGTAKREHDLLRQSGLLGLLIPKTMGGGGVQWKRIFETVRAVARVDSSLGHLYGFHHLLVATARLFGTPAQWESLWRATAAHRWFWGNALNPKDTRVVLREQGGRLLVSGQKSFCSGAVDADQLVISAVDEHTGSLVVAVIPPDRAGLRVLGDWDAFGQRQTDSGGVLFDDVVVEEMEILRSPGPLGTPFAALRPLVAQLVFVNVFLGLAEAAFGEARRWRAERRQGSPPPDQFALRRAGELWLAILTTRSLATEAVLALDEAWTIGEDLTASQRGRVAVAVAAAKAQSTASSLAVTSGFFELTGPKAVGRVEGLDRYWRNARVHTLHDPVDLKLRDLGQFALTGEFPDPSFYA